MYTTYDSFGAVVADYTFYPRPRVLYVRWHGHVTGDELVRAAHTGLQLNQQRQPRGLFHDLRQSSGEWGEDGAGAWLEHEWIPGIQAACPHLRGIAALLDAGAPVPYANTHVLARWTSTSTFRCFTRCGRRGAEWSSARSPTPKGMRRRSGKWMLYKYILLYLINQQISSTSRCICL